MAAPVWMPKGSTADLSSNVRVNLEAGTRRRKNANSLLVFRFGPCSAP